MKKRCFAAVCAVFIAAAPGAQEDLTEKLQYKRNRFIDEGFGFKYVDEELTNYELFLLRHPKPIKISEYDLGTEHSDKDIVLEWFKEYRGGTAYRIEEQKTIHFQNELDQLDAFTKDSEGNYYFFYGSRTTNRTVENMAMVKRDREAIFCRRLWERPEQSGEPF